MFELYRLLANGRHHNGPNFEFLWHFSQRTKGEEENDETKAARNYSRLNYGDEKCSQQYISFLEDKYRRVAQSRTISEFFHFEVSFKRFCNYENFKNVCILLFFVIYFPSVVVEVEGVIEVSSIAHFMHSVRRVIVCFMWNFCTNLCGAKSTIKNVSRTIRWVGERWRFLLHHLRKFHSLMNTCEVSKPLKLCRKETLV